MKKMTMSTILAAGFAVASLLPTLPMAQTVTGNVAGQPDDPIAMAYRRTLEDSGNSAATGQTATGNVAGQPDDPIAMAYRRTLEDPANSAAIGSPDDPIAMAYRRTLDSTSDTSTNLVGGEAPNGFNTPRAVNEPPIRILMRLSKGEF